LLSVLFDESDIEGYIDLYPNNTYFVVFCHWALLEIDTHCLLLIKKKSTFKPKPKPPAINY